MDGQKELQGIGLLAGSVLGTAGRRRKLNNPQATSRSYQDSFEYLKLRFLGAAGPWLCSSVGEEQKRFEKRLSLSYYYSCSVARIHLLYKEDHVVMFFSAQAKYSYFLADSRLKIFL